MRERDPPRLTELAKILGMQITRFEDGNCTVELKVGAFMQPSSILRWGELSCQSSRKRSGAQPPNLIFPTSMPPRKVPV